MKRIISGISILLLFTLSPLAAQEAERSLFVNVAGTPSSPWRKSSVAGIL